MHSRQSSWASDAPARKLEPEFSHTAVPSTRPTFGQPIPFSPQDNARHPVTGRPLQSANHATKSLANGNVQRSPQTAHGPASSGNSPASQKGSGWHIVNGAGQPFTTGKPRLSLSSASSSGMTRQSSAQHQLSGKQPGQDNPRLPHLQWIDSGACVQQSQR